MRCAEWRCTTGKLLRLSAGLRGWGAGTALTSACSDSPGPCSRGLSCRSGGRRWQGSEPLSPPQVQRACPHVASGRVERNKLISQAGNPPPAVGRSPFASPSPSLRVGWLHHTAGWQESKKRGRMHLFAWKPTRNCCQCGRRRRGCLGGLGDGPSGPAVLGGGRKGWSLSP